MVNVIDKYDIYINSEQSCYKRNIKLCTLRQKANLHDIFLLQRTTIHFVKVLHLRKQSRHGSCWNITHYHLHCHCNKKRHIVSVWLKMKLSRDFSKLWSLNLKTGLQTINWNRDWNLTRLIKQQAHVDLTYKRQNKILGSDFLLLCLQLD